jgi:hypothetical protein
LYEVFLFPTQLTKPFKEGATPKGLAIYIVWGFGNDGGSPNSQAQGE